MSRPQKNPVRSAWDRLAPLPGGRALFSRFLGRQARYSGSVRPRVEELRTGYARVSMRDRPAIRNHLDSIHAIALMNVAEIASGLALTYSLPDDARAILTGLQIEYLKKARGTITATASVEVPSTTDRQEYVFVSELADRDGDVVARAYATWLVGPRTEKGKLP